MYRSTKGASKARRDQINAEIRNMKELLPISDADKARLSYLHIMSLACVYTRKSVFFSQEPETVGGHEESARFMSFHELSQLVHGLPGFLLMSTSEGKLLYLSDSVIEHLGHSMVDLVAQGDSVYDIVDPTDHFVMRSNLAPATTPDTDRLFRCRFNTSKSARRQSAGSRLALVRARCLLAPAAASSYWTSNAVWLCFCSPVEGPPSSPVEEPTLTPPTGHAFFLAGFHSRHSQDMRVQDADDSVGVYLGYDLDALRARSWYSLLHPQDLPHASAQHCSLLSEGGEGRAEMVVRVEKEDHSFTWLYMVLHLEAGENPISCRSYMLSESEACSVRQQLCTEQTQLALVLSASASYQDSLGLQSPDTISSPDQVFTPSSSGLSGQSFDFSVAASGMSSSEELGGAAATDPMQLEGPRSSLSSLEEEGFSQQGRQPPQSSDLATPPTMTTIKLDFLTRTAFPPPVHLSGPPPLTMPRPLRQGEEFVCTPPDAPPSFMFGEPLFASDSAPAPVVAVTTSLHLPREPCGGFVYEKLPPTPETPGADGDCALLTLPLTEVRGPLYVDVPSRGPFCFPLEGLLTPETSPTQWPPRAGAEREQAQILLLAQHISSLADRFIPKFTPSSSAPAALTTPVRDPALPPGELYPVKPRRPVDTPRFPGDGSLFEESVLESLLVELLSTPAPPSSRPPSSPPSLAPLSPSTPACSCPLPRFEGGSLLGVGHLCSVQSTRCNRVAGGVPMAGAEPIGMEVESSSIPASPGPATPSQPRAQPLLGELVAMEPVFGAKASIAPVLGQQPELYQLQRDPLPQHFQPDENGSDSSF